MPIVVSQNNLEHERRSMRVGKSAFRDALASRPISDSPVLQALFPPPAPPAVESRTFEDAVDLFAGADETLIIGLASSLGQDATALLQAHALFRRRWRDITTYIRLHVDVAAMAALFAVSETWVDDLFRDAVAIEAAGAP